MKNKLGIDFTEVGDLFQPESERLIPFSEGELLSMSCHNRKSSHAKRMRIKSKSEEDLQNQTLAVTHSFPLSIRLLNLLRNPLLANDLHDFDLEYLTDIGRLFRQVNPVTKRCFDEMVLYLHLILAQVDNLNQMEEFGQEAQTICKFNSASWNETNIMNTKCILASLEKILPFNSND